MASGTIDSFNDCVLLASGNGAFTFDDVSKYSGLIFCHYWENYFSTGSNLILASVYIPVSLIKASNHPLNHEIHNYTDGTYHLDGVVSNLTLTTASLQLNIYGWGGQARLYAVR